MIKHYIITVHGRVQKVGFRYYTLHQAKDLGVCGLVRNTSDGSVYIEAEAEESVLMAFCDWCRRGPALAEVTELSIVEGKLKHYSDFSIQH
jgi:acylphosphatase